MELIETTNTPMPVRRTHTERGFGLIEFTDRDGVACSLQESSAAICEEPGTGALWLGVGRTRMHLDYKQVEWLVGELGEWLGAERLRVGE